MARICPNCLNATPDTDRSPTCSKCGASFGASFATKPFVIGQKKPTKEADDVELPLDSNLKIASAWLRLGAFVFDLVIVIYLVPSILIGFGLKLRTPLQLLLYLLLFFFYHFLFLRLGSAALGERFYGLTVLDKRKKTELATKKIFIRSTLASLVYMTILYLVYIESYLFVLPFIFLVSLENRKGSLHNELTKTIVVARKKRLFLPVLATLGPLIALLLLLALYYHRTQL